LTVSVHLSDLALYPCKISSNNLDGVTFTDRIRSSVLGVPQVLREWRGEKLSEAVKRTIVEQFALLGRLCYAERHSRFPSNNYASKVRDSRPAFSSLFGYWSPNFGSFQLAFRGHYHSGVIVE
jgi:hypothetical protein